MAGPRVIHSVFREVSSRFPDRVCMQIKKGSAWERWTYREVEALSLKVGKLLVEEGFKKGDHAAICMENRPEWAAIYLGIMSAGMICVPLDPQLTVPEISNLMRDCGSKIIFLSGTVFNEKDIRGMDHRPEKIITPDPEIKGEGVTCLESAAPGGVDKTVWPEVLPEDTASLIYTSGTTGSPKGVMLTHGNFCANFESIDKMELITDSDIIMSILPLHHAYPFMITLMTPLFCRAKVTYTSSLKSEELLGLMREAGVTVLVGVPQLFSLFYGRMSENMKEIPFPVRAVLKAIIEILWAIRKLSGINLSRRVLGKIHRNFGNKLRFFACGGAKLNEEAAKFLVKAGFTILEGYGLTETAPVVTFNPLSRQKIGSVGRAIPDVDVKIDSPDDTGTGEVLIKGPNIMKGYYKRQKETDDVLTGGWFRSGDLGHMDNEGYLYISGRKKETIVLSSGKNIYPEEIEGHYLRSPFIKEICVLGIGAGGEEEKLGAVVVPDTEQYRRSGESDLRTKIKWELENLSDSLAFHRRVRGFIVVKEDLPRTRLGKIKRFEVRERYLEDLRGGRGKISEDRGPGAQGDEDPELFASGAAAKIIKALKTVSRSGGEIQPSDHLELDLGIDSLGRVELVTALERSLGVKVPEGEMTGIFTVRELIISMEKLLSGGSRPEEPVRGDAPPVVWSKLLKEDPPEEIIGRLYLSPGRTGKIIILVISGFFRLIFSSLWRMKIYGAENIPENGKCILCVNHGSYLDGFMVAASLPLKLRKDVFFIGFRAYFDIFPVKNIIKFLRVIPIDSGARLVEAMKASSYVLRKGKMVCIFPEGGRSIDGTVQEFKKGIGILSEELGAPIVPVGVTGSYESWPRTKMLPRPRPVKINFGKALGPEELRDKGKGLGASDAYEAITLGIREEVKKARGE